MKENKYKEDAQPHSTPEKDVGSSGLRIIKKGGLN